MAQSTPPVRLARGDLAPGFTLIDADGVPFTLAELRGQRVVLYFYPAAFTPGCVREARDFRDHLAEFTAGGYQVVGVSPDPPEVAREFRAAERLSFPLLCDPEHRVMSGYGAYGPKRLYGREVVGVVRSTFVLDAEARVERAYYQVAADGHVAELRADLGLAPV